MQTEYFLVSGYICTPSYKKVTLLAKHCPLESLVGPNMIANWKILSKWDVIRTPTFSFFSGWLQADG